MDVAGAPTSASGPDCVEVDRDRGVSIGVHFCRGSAARGVRFPVGSDSVAVDSADAPAMLASNQRQEMLSGPAVTKNYRGLCHCDTTFGIIELWL